MTADRFEHLMGGASDDARKQAIQDEFRAEQGYGVHNNRANCGAASDFRNGLDQTAFYLGIGSLVLLGVACFPAVAAAGTVAGIVVAIGVGLGLGSTTFSCLSNFDSFDCQSGLLTSGVGGIAGTASKVARKATIWAGVVNGVDKTSNVYGNSIQAVTTFRDIWCNR
jgi:hypothetical protein